MNRFGKILLPLVWLLTSWTLQAQTTSESVYLQLHSQWLMAGDTLWAGVMVLSPDQPQLSALSDIVYVELWADKASPVFRTRVKVKEGVGKVGIPLDASLASGYYLVRAYTRYMRNFPQRYFFHHWIQVFQPQKPPALVEDGEVVYPLTASVHPSGSLLIDQACKVLISVRDRTGAPASTEIKLTDEDGNKVEATVTDSVDVFVFEFTPKQSSSYRFLVRISPEEETVIQLPDPTDSGVRMQLMTSGPDPLVEIMNGRESRQTNFDLVALTEGVESFRQPLFLRPGASTTIPLAQATSHWIADLVLLDADSGAPTAALTVCQPVKGNTDPVELSAELSNDHLRFGDMLPLEHSLIATYSPAYNQGISLSDFLYREHGVGGYFPSHHPEEAIIWLDQWRPLKLSELVPAESGSFAAERGLMILEGLVEGGSDEESEVYFSIPGDPSWTRRVPVTSSGRFRFSLEQIVGQPGQIVIRSANPTAEISLLPAFAPAPKVEAWPQLVMEEFRYDRLLADYRYQQSQPNFLTSQSETVSDPSPELSSAVYGRPDHTYRFADYTRMPTEEAFIEFIPEVYLRKADRRKAIFLLNEQTNQLFEESPLLMIDGIPVFSSEDILSTNFRLVDRIELVTEPFYLNGKVFSGVLNLITYQADGSSVVLNPGELRAELLLAPVFDSRSDEALPGDRVPAISQPAGVQLIPGGEEEVRIQIKGADRVGERQLWIQGLSGQGEIIESTLSIPDPQP